MTRVFANPGFGEIATIAAIGYLSHARVELILRVLSRADEYTVAEAFGSGAVADIELGAEIAAEGDEGVEDEIVAYHPRGHDGDEEQTGGDGAENDGAIGRAEENPDAAGGQEEQEGGIAEADEGPEESEEEPVAGGLAGRRAGWVADTAHFDGKHKDSGEEHAGEGSFPDPANSVLHGGGIKGPDPCRPERDAAVVAAVGEEVEEDGGGRGEDGVEREDDPTGKGGVDAAEPEDGGEQEWIEGRNPGGGAGVPVEGIGVAMAGGEGTGDTAHLVSEGEVVLEDAEAVGVRDGDVEDAQDESGEEDGARAGEDFFLARRERDGAAEGQRGVLGGLLCCGLF